VSKPYLIAGIVAGIAVFVWTSLAHTVLPLGSIGVSQIPHDETVIAALQASLGNTPGLYLFPSLDQGPGAMGEYQKKLASTPSGLLVYHAPGAQALSPRQLVVEFLVEMVEILLAVYLLSRARVHGFGGRFGFIAVTGIAVGLWTNISYWNWYAYPASYTISYTFIQIAAFLLAGLIVAAMLRKTPAL
jgi:hypothetical protein